MPSLEFKGKYHVYAHHLTVPHRPLVPDTERSENGAGVDDNLIIHGTTCTRSRRCCRAMPAA